MHPATQMVHVPTHLGESQLADSYRSSGQPPQYTHPQAVSRYAIGSSPGRTPAQDLTRYAGVGHE